MKGGGGGLFLAGLLGLCPLQRRTHTKETRAKQAPIHSFRAFDHSGGACHISSTSVPNTVGEVLRLASSGAGMSSLSKA